MERPRASDHEIAEEATGAVFDQKQEMELQPGSAGLASKNMADVQ